MSKLRRLNMTQFKKALRTAASPPNQQIESLPPNVVVPFEIAVEFDNWSQWVLGGKDAPPLTNEQRSCLMALMKRLKEMSGEGHEDLWTEDGLRCRPEWDEVREEARTILDLFGWASEGGGAGGAP